MPKSLLTILALILVIEGLLPFLNPAAWRRLFEKLCQLDDRQIRLLGLSSMLIGTALMVISS